MVAQNRAMHSLADGEQCKAHPVDALVLTRLYMSTTKKVNDDILVYCARAPVILLRYNRARFFFFFSFFFETRTGC
jgi:hypothetical protein